MSNIGSIKKAKLDRNASKIVQRGRMKRIRKELRMEGPRKRWFTKPIAVNEEFLDDDEPDLCGMDDGA